MEFALDSDQEAIVELARSILTDHCGDDQLRAFAASGQSYDADLWRLLAEAGLTGVGVAEDLGGAGFGTIETAFLLEQAGIALAPVPLRETLVCAQTLAMVGSAHASLIGEAVAGRAILASACDEIGGAWYAPETLATRDGNGWRLSGIRSAVAHSGHSSGVRGSVASDIVFNTSTNGASAITPQKASGAALTAAPTRAPPALTPCATMRPEAT